jgi:hypothetical protein
MAQAAARGLILAGTLAVASAAVVDGRLGPARTTFQTRTPRTACDGARAALPGVLSFRLRSAPFEAPLEADRWPDVAVHIPTGFDATWKPGVVVYFHGWNGCVSASMGADPLPCTDGGAPRPAGDLARQIDDAGINAILVAVELRLDAPTGEPGALMGPGGFRALLRELLTDDLAPLLGCTLDVDGLDRVVVIAHSGGYQAAAAALEFGDVPRITEVALLDALYGADDVFSRWIRAQLPRFDRDVADPLRFVDLYTCCGGTLERSRAMAGLASAMLGRAGLAGALSDDDSGTEAHADSLAHPVVIRRVAAAHGDLPRVYVRAVVAAAGFAQLRDRTTPQGAESSYPVRPK